MNGHTRPAVIDWNLPATGLNTLYGDGATRVERTLPPLTGLAAIAILAAHAVVTRHHLGWSWWHYLLAAILVYDLAGGVVAMGLNSAKRLQHAEDIPVPRWPASLVRNHLLFAAIHIQPLLVAALFPGVTLAWGFTWYAVALGGVALLTRVPLYLARPVAMVIVALTPLVATLMPEPLGFAWLPVVLITKLVLGSVREEPYRPATAHPPTGTPH